MSDAEGTPDGFEKAKELGERAEQVSGERTEQHNELLEAVAEEEELVVDETETVEIGSAELTVKTEIQGSVMRKLDGVYEGEQAPGQMLDSFVDVLSAQTISIDAGDVSVDGEEDIRLFWRDFLDRNDVERAAMLAMNRVIEEPLSLEDSRQRARIRGFRGE